MHRGTRSTVVVAVATAAVLLLLLVWSAGNGTPLVSAPTATAGLPRSAEVTAADTATAEPDEAPEDREARDDLVEWSFYLALVLWLLALVMTIVLVGRWFSRQRIEGLERREVAEEEELVALLEASSDEVRYLALSEGDPRNAVVACWVALEEAVGRSGLKPDRSQTSAELTQRVLGRWDVDPSAITTLSEAYREARFSRHPVTEEQRDAAVSALERIHLDLRRRAEAEQRIGEDAEGDSDDGALAGGVHRRGGDEER